MTLDDIRITFPEDTVDYLFFVKLLSQCANISVSDDEILATSDSSLKPTISFNVNSYPSPTMSLVTETKLNNDEDFTLKDLPFGFNLKEATKSPKASPKPAVTEQHDSIGDYLQVKFPSATYYQLSFKQLFDRLNGAVLSLDHVGLNFNSGLLPQAKYQSLKQLIAGSSFLVDYPSREEWPFIVPTTYEERNGTPRKGVNRNPKFELVYDFAYPYPEIQIDIQTKLTMKEALSLFPPPYGYHDPTSQLGSYFLSTYIYTGWNNASLRVDVRFFGREGGFTDWLLNCGKRV